MTRSGDEQKLNLLILSLQLSLTISNYSSAMNVLEEVFVHPKNIFCRYLLATRHQQTYKSVDQYLQSLKKLAKGCDLLAVTATQARDEYIRDPFINDISSNHIWQWLLENKTLDLQTALTLEMAQKQLASYTHLDSNCFCIYHSD